MVTGHYAHIEKDVSSGRYLLKKALDSDKDQSYVLYALTQEQLAHTQFPLGDMTKHEVCRIAESQRFINAHKHDSQDICFVRNGSYADFIEGHTGNKFVIQLDREKDWNFLLLNPCMYVRSIQSKIPSHWEKNQSCIQAF